MNAAAVSRVLSLIPDRIARTPTGCAFDPAATTACAHPERIAHLVQFLNWLGPLQPLSKEDLRLFGLVTPYGRPAIEAAPEDEAADVEADAEESVEAELTVPPAPADAPREPALT